MQKTYQGSCHCGAVRFQALIDLSAGTTRCNCSLCRRTRYWGTSVKPEAFTLLGGADAIAAYSFASKSLRHEFCRHCGVRPFGHGSGEWAGGEFVSINIGTLDASDEELAAAPIQYCDGRNDNWMEKPKFTQHM
ncbi:GFA family protein [Aquincola sp. S2]|uniref:GFA family protein n=1 Tax=Pseudaquabacterium terrae TaxID=2732868 RepID=A0ABX2EBW0_9BURK|nr:GFA family protein [Aquabacterium terrae]NRF65894.1 GFA family protein [Aquabacterium terrae]